MVTQPAHLQNAWSGREGAEIPRALLPHPHPGAGMHPPERTPPCFSLIPQGSCSRPAGYLLGMGQDVEVAFSLEQWRQNRIKCVDSQSKKVARQPVTGTWTSSLSHEGKPNSPPPPSLRMEFCSKEKERPLFHTQYELMGFITPKGGNGGKRVFYRKIYTSSV